MLTTSHFRGGGIDKLLGVAGIPRQSMISDVYTSDVLKHCAFDAFITERVMSQEISDVVYFPWRAFNTSHFIDVVCSTRVCRSPMYPLSPEFALSCQPHPERVVEFDKQSLVGLMPEGGYLAWLN